MVAIREEVLGLCSEVVGEFGNLLDDAQSTQCGLRRRVKSLSTGTEQYDTFFRMYVLLDPRSFSISLARSRDISSDAMFAKVHNASPTAYMFEWFMSLKLVSKPEA